MLASIAALAVLGYSGYKVFHPETSKDDALMIALFICLPTILFLCGVQFTDMDWGETTGN